MPPEKIFEPIKCSLDATKLPGCLYENTPKLWSNNGLVIPRTVITTLQNLVETYLRVMNLDSTLYPARVDIGIGKDGQCIIYEITTGFVDQVGSLLALQEAGGNLTGTDVLAQTPYDASILTVPEYRKEYELMGAYYEKSGINLKDGFGEKTFLYGYPKDSDENTNNAFPSWKGLNAEAKYTQLKVLSLLSEGTSFYIPRIFSNTDTPYGELPDERCTRLVFKQDKPKVKGDSRNTIVFGKGKNVQERYDNGEMTAQEYIPPFRDTEGTRGEIKVLFLPTPSGTSCLGAYVLWDTKPQSNNFGSTIIPNDGFPQGPVLVR